MTPSWYDVLGVEPSASTEEIRAAWRASVADLDPTDRRFKQRNRAAEVLLDPQTRRDHDETLAAEADEAAELDPPSEEPTEVAPPAAPETTTLEPAKRVEPAEKTQQGKTVTSDKTRKTRRGPFGGRGIVRAVWALAVVAVALVAVTVVAAVNAGDQGSASVADSATGDASTGGLPDDLQIQDAVDAAKAAIVPVLSYDYHHLAHDEKTAQGFMTPAYAKTYASYFSNAVLPNAPSTKTVVKVQVLDAGVVRTGPDRVDVLLFVNRPTTNKNGTSIYHDQVTARMVDTNGTWLVDCLITEQNGTCGS